MTGEDMEDRDDCWPEWLDMSRWDRCFYIYGIFVTIVGLFGMVSGVYRYFTCEPQAVRAALILLICGLGCAVFGIALVKATRRLYRHR